MSLVIAEPLAMMTLEERAESINRHFDLILKADSSAQFHRIQLGQELLAARAEVPKGKWGAWCAANIKRSRADIFRVMKIAAAKDPVAAIDLARSINRETDKRYRDKNVARPSNTAEEPLDATFTVINDDAEEQEIIRAVKERRPETVEIIAKTPELVESIRAWLVAFKALPTKAARKEAYRLFLYITVGDI